MGGLVMVSAGITLANIVAGRRPGDRAVAAPGFAINIGFGTFVEAAYPFMFSDKLVFCRSDSREHRQWRPLRGYLACGGPRTFLRSSRPG
jgi:hypothetical protein